MLYCATHCWLSPHLNRNLTPVFTGIRAENLSLYLKPLSNVTFLWSESRLSSFLMSQQSIFISSHSGAWPYSMPPSDLIVLSGWLPLTFASSAPQQFPDLLCTHTLNKARDRQRRKDKYIKVKSETPKSQKKRVNKEWGRGLTLKNVYIDT